MPWPVTLYISLLTPESELATGLSRGAIPYGSTWQVGIRYIPALQLATRIFYPTFSSRKHRPPLPAPLYLDFFLFTHSCYAEMSLFPRSGHSHWAFRERALYPQSTPLLEYRHNSILRSRISGVCYSYTAKIRLVQPSFSWLGR